MRVSRFDWDGRLAVLANPVADYSYAVGRPAGDRIRTVGNIFCHSDFCDPAVRSNPFRQISKVKQFFGTWYSDQMFQQGSAGPCGRALIDVGLCIASVSAQNRTSPSGVTVDLKRRIHGLFMAIENRHRMGPPSRI